MDGLAATVLKKKKKKRPEMPFVLVTLQVFPSKRQEVFSLILNPCFFGEAAVTC
jgi:hypothetical protein